MEKADEVGARPRGAARSLMSDTVKDPARSSYYVDESFYADLVAGFSDWQRDDRAIVDAAARDEARVLIHREARLLDRNQLQDWLGLFAAECLYWVPATPEGGDPRREVAVCFDDRRRLEDRVYRLSTGNAWSQVPRSRTVHLVSNVELFRGKDEATRMVRSNFVIHEFAAARRATSRAGTATSSSARARTGSSA